MTDVHPQFAAHGSFAHLKLGRLDVRRDVRTLCLADYLDDKVILPGIPETFDLTVPGLSYPMYGNDSLGDCTLACAGHLIQHWTAASGRPVTPADVDVEAAYWATGDPPAATGTPGGATDTGRVEIDVLNYWRQTGIGGDKIGAYVSVDPRNHDHVRAALYLFGGLYKGVALPLSAQSQPEWDVVGDGKSGASAPGSWGGHAVPDLPYWDGVKVPIVTWGAVVWATLAFNDAYVEEAYAIVSPDFLNESGVTPQGFDAAGLQADLAAITN